MVATHKSKSAEVRSRLSHPVIDADGHVAELGPLVLDYIREIGGSRMAERYSRPRNIREQYDRAIQDGSMAERRDNWTPIFHWWQQPTAALDRVTTMAPKILNQRLEEFGIDFTVLYPSQGLAAPAIEDDELRRVVCRAVNAYNADLLWDYRDRMLPVAAIPMHTPREAVEELEYAVKVQGYKVVTLQGSLRRPIPRIQREHPAISYRAGRLELFALDSDYAYDAVWAKCLELKVAPTFHSLMQAMGYDSVSNYVYNHIGIMAWGHHGLCKALFLGGVTRRFPTLKFAFLEAGVSWGCGLYGDLVAHWRKRNGEAILRLDPARLDRDRLMELVLQYGDERTHSKAASIRSALDVPQPHPEVLDDFAACGIGKAEDIRDLFAPSFYFGCEADDPMNAMAFDSRLNPFGARLRAIFGSDLGHWDVPVMSDVLHEAHELVERGTLTGEDFRDFTFVNPVTLHTAMDPDFFKGTRVEQDVEKLLSSPPANP